MSHLRAALTRCEIETRIPASVGAEGLHLMLVCQGLAL